MGWGRAGGLQGKPWSQVRDYFCSSARGTWPGLSDAICPLQPLLAGPPRVAGGPGGGTEGPFTGLLLAYPTRHPFQPRAEAACVGALPGEGGTCQARLWAGGGGGGGLWTGQAGRVVGWEWQATRSWEQLHFGNGSICRVLSPFLFPPLRDSCPGEGS